MRKVLGSLLVAWGFFVTGCIADAAAEDVEGDGTLTLAEAADETAVDKYGLSWVKEDDGTDHVIRADIKIDAPTEVIWSLVRDPNGYGSWNSALTAKVDRLEPDAEISLSIQLFAPPFPPTNSVERVFVFDDARRAVSWKRDFGFGQVTERWQLVEADGGGAHYYTALKDPHVIGWFVDRTLAKRIQAAFVEFAEALRDEAARRATP
jgi:hypothetical protein